MKETILVTGSSGFIDFHMCNKLLEENIVLNKIKDGLIHIKQSFPRMQKMNIYLPKIGSNSSNKLKLCSD